MFKPGELWTLKNSATPHVFDCFFIIILDTSHEDTDDNARWSCYSVYSIGTMKSSHYFEIEAKDTSSYAKFLKRV